MMFDDPRHCEESLRAAVLGTAIGDSWGYPYEFIARECDTPLVTKGLLWLCNPRNLRGTVD